ncbi:MAG: hydrogenase 2 maturation endopeptidase [bacterium ADurb.Bin429]|nr:MAG: hydrogenase 2 maturation endopeptidase [bacterium ADurb.Bin429]
MPPILILGLGNDIISDDAAGLLVARMVREELAGVADVVESSLSGLALLELLLGYERVIIVDAEGTGQRPPGSITEIDPAALDALIAPSPHYAGLPEMFAIAEQLGLDFPKEIRILAIEAENLSEIGGPVSEAVRVALPEAAARVTEMARGWASQD